MNITSDQTTFTIYDKNHLDPVSAKKAVAAIHATITKPDDWRHYTHLIVRLFKKAHTHFFWGEADKEIVGYVCLDQSGYLPFIAVKDARQHKGMGRALMLKAAAKAKELGCRKLELTCPGYVLDFYLKIEKDIGPIEKKPDMSKFKIINHYTIEYKLTNN